MVKFINRLWGFMCGVLLVMSYDIETYGNTIVYPLVLCCVGYFVIFGDSYFDKDNT